MFQKVRSFLHTPFGRYLVIGGLVYLFELVIIVVSQSLGASAVVSVGMSFWLGLMISFILTKFVTFGDRRTQRRVLVSQIVAVGLLVLFNFGFTLLVTDLLDGLTHPAISRTLALGVTTIWNFYLYKTRIFKTNDSVID